jgi:hypothetical protein
LQSDLAAFDLESTPAADGTHAPIAPHPGKDGEAFLHHIDLHSVKYAEL